MGWDYFGVVRFDLGPLLQGQLRIAKLKIAYNSLVIGSRGFDLGPLLQGQTKIVNHPIGRFGKPSYRKSGWESFNVVRFDLSTPPSRSNKDSQT